jgi:PAS domain S-box-containing protein
MELGIGRGAMNPSGIGTSKPETHQRSGLLRLLDLRHYGLAVFSVAVALGVALLLQFLHFRNAAVPLLLFAVAVSSWYGGTGPAVLALILSIISFYWYFVEPVRTIYIYPSEIPFFITFVGFAVLLSWFGTVRRRVEKDLRERADLLNLTHDTVFVMDMDGMIKYWNRGAEERYGWTAEQAVGKVVHDLLLTVFPAPLEEIHAEVTRTGRWEGELLHTKRDGTQVVVASRWSLQRGMRGEPVAILETNNDITERKRAEEALRRLNRELRAISNCNQTLLRATDEQSLLEEICRIVCEEAGYRMAFVAFAEDDEAKSVRSVAWNGAEAGYLASAGITWADTERGRGPTGTAIRSGKSCCVQDIATDPRTAPWRDSVLQRGFRSSIALPLKDENDSAFGSLTILAAQPNAFAPEEIRLLEELAGDMAFGIVTLRSRAARERAEQEVALLRFALENVREAALLIDDTGRIHYVNEEACRVSGYSRAELLGMAVPDIDPGFPAGRWSDHWRDLKARRSLSFESRHRTRDGRIFPVEISANYFEYGGRAYNLALVRDITERKRAEDALRQSEVYLAEAQRLSHTGSWAWDIASDKYVYVSEEDSRIWGLDPQEGSPARETVFRRIVPEDRNRVEESFQKSLREKVDTVDEYRIELPDGTIKHVHTIRHPVLNDAGDIVKFVGTSIDITERKRAEEALRRSEAYLAESQRLTHTGSFAYIPGGAILYWSEESLRIWGFDQQQAILSHEMIRQRIHPDDRGRVRERAEEAVGTKTGWYDEFRIVLPDGTVKHIHAIHHPVFSASGELVEVAGTHVDVTERKRAEEALRESETRFRTFVDHAGDALFVQDLEQGTIVDVNRQACESLGYTRQELIGDTAVAFHLESDRAGIESAAKRAATGETVVDTHYHRRKDGTVFPVEASTSSFWYGGQRFLLHVSRDITERLRAEEAVRQSEKQLRDVIEGIPAIASTIRLDGSVEFMNRRWQEYTGMSSEASVGLGWRSAGHPKDIDHYVEKRRAALASGDPFEDEVRIRSRNGEYRWFLLRGVPLRDERGNIVRWYATAIDIDDRKRAEEQRERLRQLEADLAHIDRVSLLGELAASIAHEVNQPLSGVVSNGSACLRWLAGDAPNLEEAREAARRIVRDGKRAGEVIARIRALTKKAVAPREKLNLNETIRGVLALVGDEAKRNTVVIRTRFGDDLFSVLGDQVQLQQVALNLVMNAIEAMSKVGDRARELVITTRNIDPDQVLVTVEDSGTGIDPQMIDKIFDSFYTTKPSGMGMGLSISRSILQAHGGRLWATAKDGAGTIFHFTLPKYHEAESHEGAAGT